MFLLPREKVAEGRMRGLGLVGARVSLMQPYVLQFY